MRRRAFLRTAGAGAAALGVWRPAFAAEADVVLTPSEPGPAIDPHIYGHFIEHLGGVIYDGIWVGRDSKIPNVDGIRKQFVDDMKRIGAPNLRWPGGCFADGYHWRDGIGPAADRPRTYNFWEPRMPEGVRATETNQFGIHDFMHLCRVVEAEPYVAANVGSSTPKELHDWVLYCNAPLGTVSLADERAANGAGEPFGVKYWGVGNESWGCGGDMTGGEYATEYRRFVTQFPMYVRPYLIAAGPRGHSEDMDVAWTEDFFAGMQGVRRSPVDGFALHYYTDFRRTEEDGARFDASGWYAVLHKGARMDEIIRKHWEIMGRYDAEHHTKFVIDEWGNWYRGGTELGPAYLLSQTITLRDALHSAITFDIFNRHADKVHMANVAQTINCLHSLFAVVEDRYTRTPAYYAFEMYRPHMGGRLVPMDVEVPDLEVPVLDGTATLPGLSGSASVRDGRLTVTLTNPSLDDAVSTRIRLAGGGQVAEGRGKVLTHEDMTATNSFDAPDNVTLSRIAVRVDGGAAAVTIPKQAVVALELRIA